MQARSSRQLRRVAQRRAADGKSPDRMEMRYAGERITADEQRHARVFVAVLGLAFMAAFAAYVVLAGGEIVG